MKRDKIFKRKKTCLRVIILTCTIITVNNVQIMTHDDSAAAHDGMPRNITLYYSSRQLTRILK